MGSRAGCPTDVTAYRSRADVTAYGFSGRVPDRRYRVWVLGPTTPGPGAAVTAACPTAVTEAADDSGPVPGRRYRVSLSGRRVRV